MRSSRLSCIAIAVAAVACLEAQSALTFDGGRAYEHVRRLVALGPRPAGSPALAEARKYIGGELQRLGLKVDEQRFEAVTPLGPKTMVNVMARLPGARPERIILAGHYDTKFYREFRFVGANDGGSSAAFLIEMARVLKDRKNPFTIELVWFDGEEAFVEWAGTDHTYGSRHYVEAARRAGSLGSIKALILVDMIGDRQLTIRRELNSTPWLTDLIWSSAKQLDLRQHFSSEGLAIEDDHVDFLRAGVPAVDLIDPPGDYPAWHTEHDTLDQVSARSLEVVGQVVLHALPRIEDRLSRGTRPRH